MSAYANSLQKPEIFDSYVKKFRVICVMHNIHLGSPADLPAFLQKLINDRHLSMDFWGFVGKLSDREGGELTDDQLLAVVIEGITKGDLPPEDPTLKRTVDDLRAMLAGVDIQGPGELEPEPFSRAEAHWQQPGEAWKPQNEQDKPHQPEQTQVSSHPPLAASSADHPAISPSHITPLLDEALHRLELTHLELKQHLEAIDKRMSNLEPHPDRSSAIATEPRARIATSSAKEVEQPGEPILKPVGQSRLVLEPAAEPPADLFLARKGDHPTLQIPLESYSQPPGYGRAVVSLLLVAAAAYAGYRYRVPLQHEATVLLQRIRSNTTANHSTPQDTPSTVETSTQQPQEDQPLPQQTSAPGDSAAPSNANDTLATPQQSTPTSHSGSAASGSAATRRSIPDRITAEANQTQPNSITPADLAGAVRVAPAVMESHLVDSRVPAYPDSAKIAGVEGSVVMQAIISRNGTVKRVYVIQGDQRLRNPAMEAVYKWHYRPYLLDGQPVDVATTVTVDFDLDRR